MNAFGKVTAVSPLTIVMDGDPTTQLPALLQSPYTPTVGDRVQVVVRRAGLQPIVLGKLS